MNKTITMMFGAVLIVSAGAMAQTPLRNLPAEVKYAVGIAFWVLFLLYFLFAGRNRDGERDGD